MGLLQFLPIRARVDQGVMATKVYSTKLEPHHLSVESHMADTLLLGVLPLCSIVIIVLNGPRQLDWPEWSVCRSYGNFDYRVMDFSESSIPSSIITGCHPRPSDGFGRESGTYLPKRSAVRVFSNSN